MKPFITVSILTVGIIAALYCLGEVITEPRWGDDPDTIAYLNLVAYPYSPDQRPAPRWEELSVPDRTALWYNEARKMVIWQRQLAAIDDTAKHYGNRAIARARVFLHFHYNYGTYLNSSGKNMVVSETEWLARDTTAKRPFVVYSESNQTLLEGAEVIACFIAAVLAAWLALMLGYWLIRLATHLKVNQACIITRCLVAGLLILSTARDPYSLTAISRCLMLLACCVGLYLNRQQWWPSFVPVYVVIGLTFNPLITFHLDRTSWYNLDVAAVILLLATLPFRPKRQATE